MKLEMGKGNETVTWKRHAVGEGSWNVNEEIGICNGKFRGEEIEVFQRLRVGQKKGRDGQVL